TELGCLFAAHWCQSEVCNGGFHQFFYNPTGVLAPEAMDGFDAIGLPACAQVVREAMELFDVPFPRDRDDRIDQLERLDSGDNGRPFEELDERFYTALRSQNGGFKVAADRF